MQKPHGLLRAAPWRARQPGYIGREGRVCPERKLKIRPPVFEQVLSSRLPRLIRGAALRSQISKASPMTIERPMFPPRADEHCQVISFADRQKAVRRISIRGGNPLLEGPAETYAVEIETTPRVRAPDGISETLKNKNLRDERKPQWRKAEAARGYWHARLEMEAAIGWAQNVGAPEGDDHPDHNPDERWTLLAHWRLAVAAQLMTPAADTRAIAWKKTALEAGQWKWTDLTKEKIERAIADDEAFLNSHPTRTKLLKQRG
jgi:hypothetical protein